MRKCAKPVPIIDQFGCFFLPFFISEHPDNSSSPQKVGTLNWYHSQKLQQYLSATKSRTQGGEHEQSADLLGTFGILPLARWLWILKPSRTDATTLKSSSVPFCIGSLKAQKTQNLHESTVPKYAHRTDSARTTVWTDWKQGSVDTQHQSARTIQHQWKLAKWLLHWPWNKFS